MLQQAISTKKGSSHDGPFVGINSIRYYFFFGFAAGFLAVAFAGMTSSMR